jgi:hypothetical protein
MQLNHLPWVLLSALGAAALVLIPEVLPAMLGRPEQVWTLFNSANYRAGDMYYYASMVQQVLHGHIPPHPPNSLGDSGSPESFRWLSYAVASLPGLVTADVRIVHLFTLVLPTILSMTIGIGICLYLTGRLWVGFVAAFITTFFLQAWSRLASYSNSMSPQDVIEWIRYAWATFRAAFRFITSIYEPDQFEVLRFAVPSISYGLLAGFVFTVILLDARRSLVLTLAAIVYAVLMAFSYPPHALAAYLVLISYAALNLVDRDWQGVRTFLWVGLTTILCLLLAGVPRSLMQGFAEDTFISSIYGANNLVLDTHSLGEMLSRIVLNKYVVSFIAVLYMSRGLFHLRRTVVAVGSVVLLFSLSLVFSPSTSARFLERGIDHLWLLLMSIVFWSGLDRRLNAVVASARAGLKALVAALLVVTAGFGFWVLLDINRTDARRFIPDAQWAAYDWLAKNASGQTIAALNWDDIEFIAVYHGDIKSVFGPSDLANSKPEIAMIRYVSTWKELGLQRNQLVKWLENAAQADFKRLANFALRRPTPFLSEDEFAASRIAAALVYYPYIARFNGDPVATTDASGWHTAPSFIDNVTKMFDEAPEKGFLSGAGVRLILLSNFERKFIDESRLKDYDTVYQSTSRTVLRRR